MPDIFLHIQKTGGTTLRTALRWIYGPSSCYQVPQVDKVTDYIDEPRLWFNNCDSKRIKEADLIMGHIPFGVHNYFDEPCRYFTMLRHPVKRVISRYYEIKYAYPQTETASKGLREYAEDDRNHQVRVLSGEDPLSNPTKSLSLAKYNIKNEINSFGLTEKYDESLILIKRKMGWNRYPLYVRGKTNYKRPSIDDIDSKTINTISKNNELDISLYNYIKEKVNCHIKDLEGEIRRFKKLNWIVKRVAPFPLGLYRSIRTIYKNILD